MFFSVIVCSYNRCNGLVAVLQDLNNQQVCHDLDFEVLVVDNNSNDGTDRVVEDLMPMFGDKLRYIFEPKQGLAIARNRGLKEAKGDVCIFTDDDVKIQPDWIKNIYSVFSDNQTDCAFGKILPLWPVRCVPEWLVSDARLWPALALLDYGDNVMHVTDSRYEFFGANFAVRRDVLIGMGGFNEQLGIIADKHLLGEDSDIFLKLLVKKKKIVYDPKVVVWHKVADRRLKKGYFRAWYLLLGESSYYLRKPYSFFKVGMNIFDKLFSFIFAFFTRNKKEVFFHELKLRFNIGILKIKIIEMSRCVK